MVNANPPISLIVYILAIGLVGLERLYELRLSNANARWAFSQGAIETGQRHYRVMTLMHTAFLVACVAEPVLLSRPFSLLGGSLFAGLALSAQGLRYWAISTLGKRWNTRIIALPQLEPVSGGPYRYLRHPNYVAVVLELFALPMIHGGFVTALVFSAFNAALLTVRIKAEEVAQGGKYQVAFAQRARFVPSLFRKL